MIWALVATLLAFVPVGVASYADLLQDRRDARA